MSNNSFLLEFIGERTIVAIITFVLIAVFVILLAVFLLLDYRNTKANEVRRMLYKNSQKILKHEVITVYSDKSKNFSGTEILPIPKKAPTEECSYEFVGWNKNHFNESGDTVAKAVFVKKLNHYDINFYSDDKTTLLRTINTAYGSSVDVTDLIPTKEESNEFLFEFAGWDKDLTEIKSNMNVYAIFKAYPKKYTYTFFDSDKKTVILQETAIYGTPIKLPNKPISADSSLVFSHWENYVYEMPLKKNETFVAVYKQKKNVETEVIKVENINNEDSLNEGNNDIINSDEVSDVVEEIENNEIANLDSIHEIVNLFDDKKTAEMEAQEIFDEMKKMLENVNNDESKDLEINKTENMSESEETEVDVNNDIDSIINEIFEDELLEEIEDDEVEELKTETENKSTITTTVDGDSVEYNEDVLYEELFEEYDGYDDFYDIDKTEDKKLEESEEVTSKSEEDKEEKTETTTSFISQDSYNGGFISIDSIKNLDEGKKEEPEFVQKSNITNRRERSLAVEVNGNNSNNKYNQNNSQPLYGLAGIMNPKMMVQNGYNMNNLVSDIKKQEKEENKLLDNKNNYSKVNQSEKITYNKINKTEKIIYNSNAFEKQNNQLDTKMFNITSDNKGQNILFNNARKVNNVETVSHFNSIKREENKEDITEKNAKTSQNNLVGNTHKVSSINKSNGFIKNNFINDNNYFVSEEKIKQEKENSSKLANYETFEDDSVTLPKISVFSTQKRTDSVRKNAMKNNPQNTTVQVRQNARKGNGVIFNGLINESDYKTVQENVNKNLKNNKVEDDKPIFGTILVNHRNNKK